MSEEIEEITQLLRDLKKDDIESTPGELWAYSEYIAGTFNRTNYLDPRDGKPWRASQVLYDCCLDDGCYRESLIGWLKRQRTVATCPTSETAAP
jgi:hypothetical protein